MTDIKKTVLDLQNSSMKINMYTFILGIGTIAEPRIRRTFVEQYTKTCIDQLYKDEPEEYRANVTSEAVEYFINLIEKEWNK